MLKLSQNTCSAKLKFLHALLINVAQLTYKNNTHTSET